MTVDDPARALGEAAMRGAGYDDDEARIPDRPRARRGTVRLRVFRPAETSECGRRSPVQGAAAAGLRAAGDGTDVAMLDGGNNGTGT